MIYVKYRAKGQGDRSWIDWTGFGPFETEKNAIKAIKVAFTPNYKIIGQNYNSTTKIYELNLEGISYEHIFVDVKKTKQFKIVAECKALNELSYQPNWIWDELGTFDNHFDAIKAIRLEFDNITRHTLNTEYFPEKSLFTLDYVAGKLTFSYRFFFQETYHYIPRTLLPRSTTWDLIKLENT